MTSCLLHGRPFFCREWVFGKLLHCLDNRQPSRTSSALLMGGPGSGKTSVCCEIVWPTSTTGRQILLSKRVLAYYFCQAHDVDTLSVTNFVQSIVQQLVTSTLGISSAKSLEDFNSDNCNIDELFMNCVVQPLQLLQPPGDKYLIIVDSVDESLLQPIDEKAEGSRTIAELLAKHCHLLPSWLIVVCSARRQSRSVTKLFCGFRKICLDDLRKPYIVRDIQQYILSRLDREIELRQHLSRETAEMLNQLHIKSNGCFLYVETVLNGVADGCIQLKEVRDIPGTLNGLFLWLCQHMFARRSFGTVQPILNVMLAARRPLTAMELYSCMYTTDTSLTFEDFQRHLQTIAALLVEGSDGTKIFFHHSFAEWLLDVKHCTPKYLCSAAVGHCMLAMSFSMHAAGLAPIEIQDFALHLTKSDFGPSVSRDHLCLLLIQSGANVAESLMTSWPKEPAVSALLKDAGAQVNIDDAAINPVRKHDGDDCSNAEIRKQQADVVKCLSNEPSVQVRQNTELRSEPNTSDWFTAAIEGDAGTIRKLIATGISVDCIDDNGVRALDIAAKEGYTEMVQCLIESGAAVNATLNDGWSALRLAAWCGHVDVLKLLLSSAADIDSCDPEGRSALRCAAWGGQCDTAKILVEQGASVDSEDSEGRTPLTAAVFMGHHAMVELLINLGANVNHTDIDGRTALSVAAMKMPAHIDIVNSLIDAGAIIDSEDKHGMTPLLVAAYEGNEAVCELLLDSDADVDHMDSNGRTALQAATTMGHSNVVSLLLFWGAAVDTIDNDGRTVLCLAAQQGCVGIVSELLSRGLDEMHRDNSGLTPLHIAAFEGHREAVEALVEAGAKVNETDNDGRIPLLLAAQEGHLSVVISLLERRSPLDARGHDGKTSLHIAAAENHDDIVEYLILRGANVNATDADGRSVLYLLSLNNSVSLARLLLENGASPIQADNEGRSALHVSAWQGHFEMVELLIEFGADVNAVDTEQRTPLHSAAWMGHADIAELLLQAGSAVNAACKQGATALCVATQEGHEMIVKVLLKFGADINKVDQFGRTPLLIAERARNVAIVRLLKNDALPIMDSDIFHSGSYERRQHSLAMPIYDCLEVTSNVGTPLSEQLENYSARHSREFTAEAVATNGNHKSSKSANNIRAGPANGASSGSGGNEAVWLQQSKQVASSHSSQLRQVDVANRRNGIVTNPNYGSQQKAGRSVSNADVRSSLHIKKETPL